MNIDINKYSQISFISIGDDVRSFQDSILATLEYTSILKNILKIDNIIHFSDNSRYRIEGKKIVIHNDEMNIIFKNAPQFYQNYFIVPNLIVRKS